jgi:cytochrome c oxidase subunit 2
MIVPAVGRQHAFTRQRIVVPVATPLNVRMTSADVVGGFLVQDSYVTR